MLMGSKPSLSSSALSPFSDDSMVRALCTAFFLWSSTSNGAFQKAMMQSPMYLSMVPSLAMMTSVMGVKKRFMSLVKP